VERWSLNFFYGLSDALMLEVEVPILHFGGGFMANSSVMGFHKISDIS
jgi:hypothetical protein